MILAVADAVWNALIAGAVTIVMAWMAQRASHKLTAIAEVADKTHILVNSNMGVQLKLHAVSARRLADITNSSADIEAALLADKMLAEHEGKQAIVDRKP